jgi:hypothetical protein
MNTPMPIPPPSYEFIAGHSPLRSMQQPETPYPELSWHLRHPFWTALLGGGAILVIAAVLGA